MRIAICDDDTFLCGKIAEVLRKYQSEYGIRSISTYHSGAQLWFEYQNSPHPFDLIILDIQLPGSINGIEVGRYIRKAGDDVVIVILTAFKKYALEGYDIQPYRYLLKPVEPDHLRDVLDYVKKRMEQLSASGCLHLFRQGSLERIPFRDLLFLESRGHNLYVYVTGEKTPRKHYAKLTEVLEQCDLRFTQIHKSYAVNIDKIRSINVNTSTVRLENDRDIPISRRRKASFIKEVMEYDRNCRIAHD